jgi:hypothetical protein
MKNASVDVLSTNLALTAQFSRLVRSYPNMAFAVAWASADTAIFRQLLKRRRRISRAVIGIHFYQTHPDVLDKFVGSTNVRFVLQPHGVFHPKVFLFWGSKQWEALVGSANLTSGAFGANSEVVTLLRGCDEGSNEIRHRVVSLIDGYWPDGRVATREIASKYRAIWKFRQPLIRRLAASYGQGRAKKVPLDSTVMSMPWNRFFAAVKNDRFHGLAERCDLLSVVATEFRRHEHFRSMELGVRQAIAGWPTDFDPRWAWFGSMRGVGNFGKAVNENNIHLSRALDQIPLEGVIQQGQYDAYVEEFTRAFPHGRDGVATASRLLAMKRPDQFVCVDSKNQRALCEDFGIAKTGMTYERYWAEVVERVMDSPWWNSPRPRTPQEANVWNGRAAMLDAIFYEG